MDIAATLSGIGSAISALQSWRQGERAFEAAAFKAQLADVIGALTDAKLSLAEAKEQLAAKDAEIARLKQAADDRRELTQAEGGYLYLTSHTGAPTGFPVCPKCNDNDGRLTQLVQDGKVKSAKCPRCDTRYDPVTCYLEDGGTLYERHVAEMTRKSDEADRRAERPYSEHSWMR